MPGVRMLRVEVDYFVNTGSCRVTAWDARDDYYWRSVPAPDGDRFRRAVNAKIDSVPPKQTFVTLNVTGKRIDLIP
jgi:hypothetical protein